MPPEKPYHPANKHEGIILAPLNTITTRERLLWGFLLGLMGLGAFAFSRQITLGMGVTGMNRPVYWGIYIANFVFFIGLAHSGSLISAILRLVGAEWRKPVTRAAEAITIFSLPFGVMSIAVDMGRPERLLSVIAYGRFQSQLLWDFTAVSLYMFSSVVFFYLSLLPDIALCRDRLTDAPAWRRRMYKVLALGWQGREEQFRRLELVLDGMAVFMAILVVIVSAVVSWVFGITLLPGWHTALSGPFFLLGALFSGTAAVVIVLAILRRAYHLEEVLTINVFNSLRKLLIALTLGWLYMMVAERLTVFYANLTEEMEVLWQEFTGDFAMMFWLMTLVVFIIPLLIFVFRAKNSIAWMVTASICVNIGMWLERYIIVVPPETRPRLLYELAQGFYRPTWVEYAITISLFAGLTLLYAVFTRFFPVIPLWETVDKLEFETPSSRRHRPIGAGMG